MALRIPRGYARRHPGYQELFEGTRPTLKWLRAADFLPVAEIEPSSNDPIVIPAGTFVGVATDGGAVPSSGLYLNGGGLASTATGVYVYNMVPAASNAYTLTYSADDWSTAFFTSAVKDIDTDITIVSSHGAGASTATVGGVGTGLGIKPLGIAYQDIYASWLSRQYTNYAKQPNITLLMANQVIQVPCRDVNEWAIEPGDLVMVAGFDQGSLTWAPQANPTAANAVGRLQRYVDYAPVAGATTAHAVQDLKRIQEHVVGRCIRKILVAQRGVVGQSVSPGVTKLSTFTDTGATSSVNYEFRPGGRVQTVPGLGLQGSGTLGVPGHLLNARDDGHGLFWALEIAVGTY